MPFARLFTKNSHFLVGFGFFGLLVFASPSKTETAPLYRPEYAGIFADQQTFPQMTAYLPAVFRHAETEDVSPALALAIMRQESSFDPKAKSPMGALGLMQLMPDTAHKAAYERGGTPKLYELKRHLVEQPEVNISLGIHHLADMQEKLSGVHNSAKRKALLLASYNAGMARVARAFDCQSLQCLTYKANYHGRVYFAQAMARLPRETTRYITRVQNYEEIYTQELLAAKF